MILDIFVELLSHDIIIHVLVVALQIKSKL